MPSIRKNSSLLSQSRSHGPRTAIVDSRGTFTYSDLFEASARVATALLAGRDDLHEERVAAALVLKENQCLDLQTLRQWARDLLAAHKLPSRLLVLEALPRNAMGKVTKPDLAGLFQTQGVIDV